MLEAMGAGNVAGGSSGAAAAGGGGEPYSAVAGRPYPANLDQAVCFSLQHHEQLLQGFTPPEQAEMQAAIAEALAAASGVVSGWVIEAVGGSRRLARPAGKAAAQRVMHDAGGVYPAWSSKSLAGWSLCPPLCHPHHQLPALQTF